MTQSPTPAIGQIWFLLDNGGRYEILALGKQKEMDGNWHAAVIYRSEADRGIYSRRAESFQARFVFTGEHSWTAQV